MQSRYIVTQEIITDDSGLISIKVLSVRETFPIQTPEEEDEENED